MADHRDLRDLLQDIRLLCLDAGNTVVFLDHPFVAELLSPLGIRVTGAELLAAEGRAKTRMGAGAMEKPVPHPLMPASWSSYLRTIIAGAVPLSPEQSQEAVLKCWQAHREFNLWRKVPEGFSQLVNQVRALGIPVAVISNSEGKLVELFEQVGLNTCFDLVLDSLLVGHEKPHPAIFQRALAHFSVEAKHALHIGDIYAIDVLGARQVGMQTLLNDPWGHHDGQYPDVLHIKNVREVLQLLLTKN